MVSLWCEFLCVCLAYTSEDFHMKTHRYTEDSTPSEDPKTGPRKTLAKNAKIVMFYHLRGVRAPRTSTDFQPYLIYEDIRVLGSISKASGGGFFFFFFFFVCLFFFLRLDFRVTCSPGRVPYIAYIAGILFLIWFLFGVRFYVIPQIRRVGEVLLTTLALIWFLFGVSFYVFL